MLAATCEAKYGGKPVLKIKVRARLIKNRRSLSDPQTNAPAADNALPHV
jgi:hypothetical protein